MKKCRCADCFKEFKTPYYLNRHLRQVHKVNLAPIGRGRPCVKKYHCCNCNAAFSTKKDIRKHIVGDHNERNVTMICPYEGCIEECKTNFQLSLHFSQIHGIIKSGPVLKDFSSWSDFVQWKLQEERATGTRFVQKTGTKSFSDKLVSRFHCHRSGKIRRRGKGIRRLKIQGSQKIGSTCPAFMEVSRKENETKLKYFYEHYGHANDIAHLNLTKPEREQLAEQIKQGIPLDIILKNVRECLKPEMTPLHLLKKHDLHNISRDFIMIDDEKCQENDVINENNEDILKIINGSSSSEIAEIEDMIDRMKLYVNMPEIDVIILNNIYTTLRSLLANIENPHSNDPFAS